MNPFKIGDKVYVYPSGWHIVEYVDKKTVTYNSNKNGHPIYAKFDIEIVSFTEYDPINGGLTHERPGSRSEAKITKKDLEGWSYTQLTSALKLIDKELKRIDSSTPHWTTGGGNYHSEGSLKAEIEKLEKNLAETCEFLGKEAEKIGEAFSEALRESRDPYSQLKDIVAVASKNIERMSDAMKVCPGLYKEYATHQEKEVEKEKRLKAEPNIQENQNKVAGKITVPGEMNKDIAYLKSVVSATVETRFDEYFKGCNELKEDLKKVDKRLSDLEEIQHNSEKEIIARLNKQENVGRCIPTPNSVLDAEHKTGSCTDNKNNFYPEGYFKAADLLRALNNPSSSRSADVKPDLLPLHEGSLKTSNVIATIKDMVKDGYSLISESSYKSEEGEIDLSLTFKKR